MIDPLSYFTGAAVVSGAIEAGKWIATSAASGVVGNSSHAAVCHIIPEIQRWYRGEGQPANHDIQRALRTAYLAATKRLVEHALSDASHISERPIYEDSPVWCDQALDWVRTQTSLLKDEHYHPPAPPGGWEPAYIVEPAAIDAAAEVAALRDSLSRMLVGEWTTAGLRTPPDAVSHALAHGWTESDDAESARKADWFDLISLYFAQEIRSRPHVQAIFQADTSSKILIEVRALRKESAESRTSVASRAFFAPNAPDYFVGREAALGMLGKRLAEPGAVVPLAGMAGLGKTSLAIAFAHRRQADFEGIYWIGCVGQSLPICAAALSIQLGIAPEGEPESLIREIRHRCAERHYLLVLDNVESNDIRRLIPEGRCSVLLTTRLTGLPFLAKYRPLDLHLFSPEECLQVFREHLPGADVSKNESAYLQLGEHLGRLPIAVAVAAGLLRNDVRYTLGRLLAEARPNKLAHGELDIGSLLNSAIASASEEGRALLSAMAVCAPSGFRLGLAGEIAHMDESAALDALQDLRARSLVDIPDRKKLLCHLHSLIRAEAGQEPSLQQSHAEAVVRGFASWEASWYECDEDLDDWRLALAWAADGKGPRAERMGLLGELAFSGFQFAYRRGLPVDALRAMKAVAAAYEELGNRDGLQASYGNQAIILQAWGRLQEAMALLKKQEAICEELGNRDGLQRSYGNQALILQAWGRPEEAMALHKKQEAICEELGDRDGLQASYGNQAVILKAWGRPEEAMALHKNKEAICEELGNRDGLQASYGNQAIILQAWGRLEEAMALHKKQEAICEELGNRDGLHRSYGNQAVILKAWGRLAEAMALLKNKEAICEELGNRDSLQRSYGNQAIILQAWGRLEEAMALHKKQEAICEELGNRDGLQCSYGNQAVILIAWGRLEEAMALLKNKEAICEKLGNRASLAYSFWNQGRLARMQGNDPEAAEKLQAALQLFTEIGLVREREAVRAYIGDSSGPAYSA